ncbi:MAG TPA: DinB family protein [Methylomirabilota bacterium]|nr:DinB family protein [Methylomirabilota bacterium]
MDLAALIRDANEARARLLERARGVSAAQGAFKPPDDEWSIAENVEHLVLAEQGCINRTWAAADGLRRGQPVWRGAAVHRGKPIEQIVRETWGPATKAPDPAAPRRRGPLAYWLVALQCNQPLLDALPGALDGLDPHEVITPHPISGPWDAAQWLAFVRLHLQIHGRQIEAVTRAPGFPTA